MHNLDDAELFAFEAKFYLWNIGVRKYCKLFDALHKRRALSMSYS